MQGASVELLRDFAELESFRDPWKDLSRHSPPPIASYEEYRDLLCCPANHDSMHLVVLRENGQIVTLAPFLLSYRKKSYTLGVRRLFSLPIRTLRLMNDCFIGKRDSEQIRHVFNALVRYNDFDLISFGEHELEGPFFRSIKSALADSPWRCVIPFHKVSIHWFIDLPSSFDDYMSGFSAKTRYNLRRELRSFDTKYCGRTRVVTTGEDVDWFLTIGEQISRLTYQWNLGQRIRCDESSRREYLSHAEARRLRCYILFAGEQACAFGRGTIKDGVYNYERVGFDPRYEKASPGTVLLLRVIEDLIVNTDCRILDFGSGGDYKKIFGNRSYEVVSLEVGRRWSFYPMLLFGIQDALNLSKRCGNAVLGEGRLKKLIKRRLKKYGTRPSQTNL